MMLIIYRLIVVGRILIFDIKLCKLPLETAALRFQVVETVHAVFVRMGTISVVFVHHYAHSPFELALRHPRSRAFCLV